ncbi:MAG: amidohydrolase family protein, partial [Lachnospiraceae bacterium]|nr:amidohydrolase family protein [Lachnospiraceae bacterium]
AKALGLENEIGQIKIGLKADLVTININNEHFMPATNAVSALTYSAAASDVDTVIVDGKILMDKKVLKTIDEEHVFFAANRIAKRIGLR